MSRMIVVVVSGVLAVVSAMWLYASVVRAVTVEGASEWFVPGVAASIMIVALLLFALLTDKKWHVSAVATVTFASALIFAPSGLVVLMALIATALYYLGWLAMHESMEDHLRLRPFTHARLGATRLTLAISLMISSVFFVAMVQRDAGALVFGKGVQSAFDSPMATSILPQPLKNGSGPGGAATVDDFLRYVINQQGTNGNGGATNGQQDFLEAYADAVNTRIKDVMPSLTLSTNVLPGSKKSVAAEPAALAPVNARILAGARAQLSEQIGQELTGQELVSDVFASSLNRTITTQANKKLADTGYKFSTALSSIFAVFLFLTVYWVGSMLKFIWAIIVRNVFVGLVKIGVVRVVKVPAEREQIS